MLWIVRNLNVAFAIRATCRCATLSAKARRYISACSTDAAQVLQHLDGEGLSRAAAVLRSLPQDTVLVVGQAHSFVSQIFDTNDVVVKCGGSSFIEVA